MGVIPLFPIPEKSIYSESGSVESNLGRSALRSQKITKPNTFSQYIAE